jgi:hypothetical protein
MKCKGCNESQCGQHRATHSCRGLEAIHAAEKAALAQKLLSDKTVAPKIAVL